MVGSRDADIVFVQQWLCEHASLIPASGIVTGDCPTGADNGARNYADRFNVRIVVHKADWDGPLKKGAGPARNTLIVNDCASMIAFWDGISRGTIDSITKAVKAGKMVRIVPVLKGKGK